MYLRCLRCGIVETGFALFGRKALFYCLNDSPDTIR